MAYLFTSNINLLYTPCPGEVSFFFRKALHFPVGLTCDVSRPFAGPTASSVNWAITEENLWGDNVPRGVYEVSCIQPRCSPGTESRKPRN